jgi:hypothetical protein
MVFFLPRLNRAQMSVGGFFLVGRVQAFSSRNAVVMSLNQFTLRVLDRISAARQIASGYSVFCPTCL